MGQKETRFLLHRELLTYYSPFFSATLDGAFAEGLSQVVKLKEERLEIFEFFVHWLYTQHLEDAGLYKDGRPTYFNLLELYSLADRLLIEKLRNDTVDKIAQLAEATNSVLTPSDTYILYDTIRPGADAPIRRLVLDLFAFKRTDNLLANHPDDWHPLFLRDLVVKLKRPGYAAMIRHDLKRRKTASWSLSKACDVCKVVLKPQMSGNSCTDCLRVFCDGCVQRGTAVCADLADSVCKPWKRSICSYHEHVDTVICHGGGGGGGATTA